MIQFDSTRLDQLAIHRVNHPDSREGLILAEQLCDIEEIQLKQLLFEYFLSAFEDAGTYQFEGESKVSFLSREIFEQPEQLLGKSQEIAQHLFDNTQHSGIRDGELFIAYFSQINYEDELTDAIGIFKAETIRSFLKINRSNGTPEISFDHGIPGLKPDKSCLIFNTESQDGYRIYLRDSINLQYEAKYWRKDFLGVAEFADNYHYTSNMLDLTRSFVKQKLQEEHEVERVDEIDMLNKTINYFKENEVFDRQDYGQQVFKDEGVAQSFEQYASGVDLDIKDGFEISVPAVDKRSRVFRSVLKLDKNFHIYIHGDRSKILRGVESDGRRFYKVYFENES